MAVLLRGAILGLLVWLIVYMRPRLGMLLTGQLDERYARDVYRFAVCLSGETV